MALILSFLVRVLDTKCAMCGAPHVGEDLTECYECKRLYCIRCSCPCPVWDDPVWDD